MQVVKTKKVSSSNLNAKKCKKELDALLTLVKENSEPIIHNIDRNESKSENNTIKNEVKYEQKETSLTLQPYIVNEISVRMLDILTKKLDYILNKHGCIHINYNIKQSNVVFNMDTVIQFNRLIHRIGGDKLCFKMTYYYKELMYQIIRAKLKLCQNDAKYKYFSNINGIRMGKPCKCSIKVNNEYHKLYALRYIVKLDMNYNEYVLRNECKFKEDISVEFAQILGVNKQLIKIEKHKKGSIKCSIAVLSAGIVGAIMGALAGPVGACFGAVGMATVMHGFLLQFGLTTGNIKNKNNSEMSKSKTKSIGYPFSNQGNTEISKSMPSISVHSERIDKRYQIPFHVLEDVYVNQSNGNKRKAKIINVNNFKNIEIEYVVKYYDDKTTETIDANDKRIIYYMDMDDISEMDESLSSMNDTLYVSNNFNKFIISKSECDCKTPIQTYNV